MKKMNKSKNIFFVFVLLFLSFPFFAKETSASDFFDLGIKEQQNEQWYLASQHFLEACNLNPVYFDAWFHLAQCSYQLGEFELVLDQLSTAELYSPYDNNVKNLRGMTFIALGKFDDARKIFEEILKAYPNNVDARFGLAELDLFDGKLTGAESQYLEALKRQSENRKALLSLAVISAQLGKKENARKYIEQAVKYYSGEAEVHYLASVIYSLQNNISLSEKHARVAVEINGNYDKAYELLAKLLFLKKEYDEVISICDFRISRNRNLSSAWYLKGQALYFQNNFEDAIETWSSGLRIFPEDEIMRTALELCVNKIVPIEDERRIEWSSFHEKAALDYAKRFDNSASSYEYQRALRINPSNENARLAYADILEMNGMHEIYLEQLLFIRENQNNQRLNDTIEAYSNLLEDTLAKKWNIEPFYLDKTRWSMAIFYQDSSINMEHVENNRIASSFASDIFTGLSSCAVKTYTDKVQGYGEAYQKARNLNVDYFVILELDEGKRDITLDFQMYSARTGYKLIENTIYETGNFRFSTVFRRFRNEILEHLPIRGKILARDGKILLCDLGRSENIRENAVFEIVKKNSIQTAGKQSGVVYKEDDILGTFTITACGEEVSEGLLEYNGFYDRINTGDEIVLISLPSSDEENALKENNEEGKNFNPVNQTSPLSDANGNSINQKKTKNMLQELKMRRYPSFIDLIRSIY